MGADGELLEPGDHLLSRHHLVLAVGAVADIVDAEKNDNMGGARLCQRVAVEALESAIAAHVVQDAVAADALVHHAYGPAPASREPPRKLIRPAMVGIEGG